MIARPHGVRGELRLHLHNPESMALEQADSLLVGETWYPIESARYANSVVLLRLEGVGDRNVAETLKGKSVSVERNRLGLEDDEVLLVDMVGLQVVLQDGTAWGQVSAVESGAQDRLIVRGDGVIRELPIVDAFVLSIDLETKTIVVDPPDELPERPDR